MNRALEVESLTELALVGPTWPVFFLDSPVLDLTYPEPAFLAGPFDDLPKVVGPNFTLVASSKKEATALKKIGYRVESVDASPTAAIKAFGLSRASMRLSSIKKAQDQVQAASAIGLLGETPETLSWVFEQYVETSGFILQEAFLQCNVRQCLRLADAMAPSEVVGAAALLLSGHTTAFMIAGSSVKEMIAAGFNSFYVNKIRDMSGTYTRRVGYEHATTLLTSVLPRIKTGEEPTRLFRRTILGALSRVY